MTKEPQDKKISLKKKISQDLLVTRWHMIHILMCAVITTENPHSRGTKMLTYPSRNGLSSKEICLTEGCAPFLGGSHIP